MTMLSFFNKAGLIECDIKTAISIINGGDVLYILPSYEIATPHKLLLDERTKALKNIANAHAEMLTQATRGATSAERDTWPVQLAAAHDIVAGGDGEGVLIPKPGETLEQLAAKLLAKSQMYKRLVGIAAEIKRSTEQEVETLPLQTLDDLAALAAVLDAAKQRANAALAAAT